MNRRLGMQSLLTDKLNSLDYRALALILLSNSKPGDVINFAKGNITIVDIDDELLSYSFFNNNTGGGGDCKDSLYSLESGIAFQSIVDTLPLCAPISRPDFGTILERDPAVYRLRNGDGWVINDKLALTSGNVVYEKTCNSLSNNPSDAVKIVSVDDNPSQSNFDF